MDTGGTIPLERKKEANIWDNIEDFLKVLKMMREKKWSWINNSPCKYVNLRVDMRDGGCIIMNREGERISPQELEYQWKKEDY